MSMTKQERATRTEIARFLRMQGYVTYAGILIKLELNFHNPPQPFAASMNPKTGTIYLNPTIRDKEAVSTLIRHEILHNYLTHELRLLKHLAQKSGLNYDDLDDLSIKKLERVLYGKDTFNIAADYEISNRGYTDNDKEVQRKIGHLGDIYQKALIQAQNQAKRYGIPMDQVSLSMDDIKGLVTEDDHPDWIYDSVEEMYDKLTDEINKEQQNLEKEDAKNDRDKEQNDKNGESDDVIVGMIFPDGTGFFDPSTGILYKAGD